MTYIPVKKTLNKSSIITSRIVFFFVAFFLVFAMPVDAKEKKKSKKKKVEVVVTEINPDPICKRSKPDSHPRPHEAPNILFGGMSGAHGVLGIDISHYQGKIDWSYLSTDSHVGFVYIKATEGVDLVDNTYSYNISEARRHGVKVGSYHFFRPNTSASEQFRNIKRAIEPGMQDLLPVIDVEVMPKGISKSAFDKCLLELLQLMEKEYGKKPLIYTGKNFYNKHFYGTRFASEYKFWIAAYNDNQPVLLSDDDYLIWQYTAKGKVRGVKGYVDLNKFVGRHVLNEIKF